MTAGLISGCLINSMYTGLTSDWQELKILQNTWHLRLDDDLNNNMPNGTFGLRSGDLGTEVMVWAEDGNVGIGTISPDAKLEVAGQVKITGGNPGANKVLTSDANGLSAWQSPTERIGTVLLLVKVLVLIRRAMLCLIGLVRAKLLSPAL